MEIAGKNIVYIGGSGGIGSSTCKLLAEKNVANLVILDLVENVNLKRDIEEINPSTEVCFLELDLRCKEDIANCLNEVISRIGSIDILINGSGLFNENDAELTIGVNLLGLINTTMIAMNLMDTTKGNRGGLIVNIASVAGLCPLRTSAIYSASKAGVIMFTRSMAEQAELRQNGVSLIAICPGLTETTLLEQLTSETKSPFAKLVEESFSEVKMQTADECAQNIVKAIEKCQNGQVWMCDVGELEEITFPYYWIPQIITKEN